MNRLLRPAKQTINSLKLAAKTEDVFNIYVPSLILFFTKLPPKPTLDHWQRGSLTHPKSITTLSHIRQEDSREPCGEVGSETRLSTQWGLNRKLSDSRVALLPTDPPAPA